MANAHDHDHDHDHDHPHPRAHHHEPDAFIGVQPILNVANVAASLAYYRERLGFDVCWAWSAADQFQDPAAPTFAEVMRGKCVLNLAQQDQGGPGMWLFVDVATRAGLESVRQEYQRTGVVIAALPEDKPWGRREMLVHDLDGHTLRLSAPSSDD